jgi:hypothetical protein
MRLVDSLLKPVVLVLLIGIAVPPEAANSWAASTKWLNRPLVSLGSEKPSSAQSPQDKSDGIEVAPQLRLSSEALVWILEDDDGTKRLLPVRHHDAKVTDDAAANFARSVVFAKQKKIVVVAGGVSDVRVHTRSPTLFVVLTEGEEKEFGTTGPDKIGYAIIGLESASKMRAVGKFDFSRFKGKPTFTQSIIETKQARLPNSQWLQLVPAQPLPKGEYALVQTIPRNDGYSPWVFDFGVD